MTFKKLYLRCPKYAGNFYLTLFEKNEERLF